MKKLLLIALLVVPTLIKAQEKPKLPIVDGNVIYEDVVNVEGLTKDQLYQSAKTWYSTKFSSQYYSTIKVDNKQAGIFAIKSRIKSKYKDLIADKEMEIDFVVQLNLKDNKYRIQLMEIVPIDVYIKNNPSSLDPKVDLLKQQDIVDNDKGGKKTAEKIINMVNMEMTKLMSGIKKGMSADDF